MQAPEKDFSLPLAITRALVHRITDEDRTETQSIVAYHSGGWAGSVSV